MAITVADIRRRKQAERLSVLQQQANVVLGEQPGGSLWLFGSWARGDWDGFSDVDVLAVASNRIKPVAWQMRCCGMGWPMTCWPSRSRNGRSGGTGMTPTGAPSDAMPFV